jgi:hypothetical protein
VLCARHNLALGVLVGSAFVFFAVLEVVLNASRHYAFLFFGFFQFTRLADVLLLAADLADLLLH